MHSPQVLEHFQNPRNSGHLPPPAVSVDVTNPACGDMMRLSAKFEGDRAVEVRYQTRGCTASIAAGSALTEWMTGKTKQELLSISPDMIDQALGGLPLASKHAAVLCVDAVKRLLS